MEQERFCLKLLRLSEIGILQRGRVKFTRSCDVGRPRATYTPLRRHWRGGGPGGRRGEGATGDASDGRSALLWNTCAFSKRARETRPQCLRACFGPGVYLPGALWRAHPASSHSGIPGGKGVPCRGEDLPEILLKGHAALSCCSGQKVGGLKSCLVISFRPLTPKPCMRT
jgi:hypothetical protein